MMTKKVKRNLIGVLFAGFVLLTTAFGFSLKSQNVTANAEVATSSEFTMEKGAAIRISEEKQGIRFATKISSTEYQRLVELSGGNGVQFGTLCMPEKLISAENPLDYTNLASETNQDGAVNIVTEKWLTGYEPTGTGSTFAYVSALLEAPTDEYFVNLCARSYVKVGDEIIYTDNTVTRSYAGVALAAYADTSEEKPGDTDKSSIYNAYLSGRAFAGLDAKSISYDSTETAITALDDEKVKVTEAGETRAWKNVFYKWSTPLEQGETYRISFDLDIAETTNCDLYLGLVNNNVRLDDAFGNIYKKLSTGEVSFTYVPAETLETFSLMIFSNYDTSGGTYQYEYTIDNISVAKMSYVTTGDYALPFTVSPMRTDFIPTASSDMLQSYGAFSVIGNTTTDAWCGATFTFDEVKAGKYLFNVKVKNNSAEAKGFYIFYNAGAGNKATDTVNNISIEAGATKEYSVRIDVAADTTGFLLHMFAMSETHEFVFGDLTVYNAERTSNSSAVSSYTVKYINDAGDNPATAINTVFVPTTTTLTENSVGTVSSTTIKSWQGIYIDFGTLAAGEYKLSLQVHNLSGASMYLYSRKFINNVQSGLFDFNSVADNTTATLNQTITLSETSSFMIRIFSANNGSNISSFKFEIGSLTLGASKIANEGTLGGDFTSFTASSTTMVRSVANPSIYANNFVGTVTCGEGSGWRGMYTRIDQTFAAGTYTFTFTVTNRTRRVGCRSNKNLQRHRYGRWDVYEYVYSAPRILSNQYGAYV